MALLLGATACSSADDTTPDGAAAPAASEPAESSVSNTVTVTAGQTTVATTAPAAPDTTASPGTGGNATASSADPAAVAAAVDAATAFLATLSEDQRDAVMFDFTDLGAKQSSWSNFPVGIFDGRRGARMGDLDDAQRAAALTVVETMMSAAGYDYVEGVMAGDELLAGGGRGSFGQDEYFLAFYGEPSSETPWTMQFGGHHLAIHLSVGGEALSVSPYFQGLQPVSYELEGTTIEAMKTDADDLFGLFESMDADQLAAAQLPGAYDDLVMGPGSDTGYPASEGLPFTELNADQQQLVRAAIADWVSDAAPGISDPFIAMYEAELDSVVVGWSNSIDRSQGAYMRIDGPRVWIEWINTTAGGGLHYHTIYRDKLVDYGTGTAG
jgi:hypothetical protein